jgi:hypothetical protein
MENLGRAVAIPLELVTAGETGSGLTDSISAAKKAQLALFFWGGQGHTFRFT